MDRIDEWRAFAAVERQRSFSQAARALRVSPQAVTRAVAGLEARIGVRLLNRTTRSVSLTSEGELYLERSRQALAEFDRLEEAPDTQADLRGSLAVTASVLFGQLHVLPIALEFLTLHPALELRLVLLDRVVALAEEGIDLGVRIGALPDSSLRARLVGHVRQVVCASAGYLQRAGVPRTPQALADHACIAFTTTTPVAGRWTFRGRGRLPCSVAVRPRLLVNTAQAAIDAALAGAGCVRVLSYQINHLVADNKLRIVLAGFEPPPVPVHLVQLPGARNRAAVAFVDFAGDRLRRRLRG
jgi:DNA-binding transcriptional LysR family regulator